MATVFDLSAIRSDVSNYAATFRALIGVSGGGSGDALTTNPLSQFAATTSAQLAGVITDETGTGFLVFSDAPTFTGTASFVSIATTGTIQVGSSGARLKNATGILEVRNAADSAYAQINASNVRAAGYIWFGGSTGNNVHIYGTSSGVIELYDSAETGFTRMCLGGAGTSHPSIKRNGTAINFRLANDSADCAITASNGTFSGLVSLGVYTVATLPSASSNTGAMAQVTDSSVFAYGSIVASGGTYRRTVYSNGTNWIIS